MSVFHPLSVLWPEAVEEDCRKISHGEKKLLDDKIKEINEKSENKEERGKIRKFIKKSDLLKIKRNTDWRTNKTRTNKLNQMNWERKQTRLKENISSENDIKMDAEYYYLVANTNTVLFYRRQCLIRDYPVLVSLLKILSGKRIFFYRNGIFEMI